jgi:hypothetical protein
VEVLEAQTRVIGAAMAELLPLHALAYQAVRVRLDEKGADAAMAQARVACGEDDGEIGDAAIRDPHLLAV